ncbi:sulfotransferase family 2 domain-containing protein [Tropicimonas sp. S265A]|uniref:sulfotransferase family 2 domain-containing protein n=1 Tax=Tropicimonas sp. S265A TaxID=3415134 RepID=UPI003C7D808F
MLVFHNQSIVLLGVPKTGTSALEAAVARQASVAIQGPPTLRHMTFNMFQRDWAPVLQRTYNTRFETMAIIREPLERLRSWYRYRALPQFEDTPLSSRGMDFDTFIEQTLQADPPRIGRIGAQDQFVNAPDGRVGVTHLFDYAQLDRACAWLADRLKRDITLPPRNVSPDVPAELSSSLETQVRAVRAAEFALYQRVAQAGHLEAA